MASRKVSNIGVVLYHFFKTIQPGLREFGLLTSGAGIVSSDELTYEAALKKIQGKKKGEQDSGKLMPFLAWRRGPLQIAEETGDRRSLTDLQTYIDPTGEFKFGEFFWSVEGKLDLEYTYFTNSMSQLEMMEVAMVGLAGPLYIPEFYVPFPELERNQMTPDSMEETNSIPYEVFWGTLDEKRFRTDNTAVKSLRGSVTIRGTFFIFKMNTPRIWQILVDVKGWGGEPYGTVTIPES